MSPRQKGEGRDEMRKQRAWGGGGNGALIHYAGKSHHNATTRLHAKIWDMLLSEEGHGETGYKDECKKFKPSTHYFIHTPHMLILSMVTLSITFGNFLSSIRALHFLLLFV